MRPVNQKNRDDRINAILDAAQLCFSRSGFHGSSVQQICAEAGMSPGNLYRYFPSKEALVAGLCQRDMEMLAADIEQVVQSSNTWEALTELARHNLMDRSREELVLWVETTAEATRNPAIAEITQNANRCVEAGLRRIFTVAADRGEIGASADIDLLISFSMTLFMGLIMRLVKEPDLDLMKLLSMQVQVMATLVQTMPVSNAHRPPLKAVP